MEECLTRDVIVWSGRLLVRIRSSTWHTLMEGVIERKNREKGWTVSASHLFMGGVQCQRRSITKRHRRVNFAPLRRELLPRKRRSSQGAGSPELQRAKSRNRCSNRQSPSWGWPLACLHMVLSGLLLVSRCGASLSHKWRDKGDQRDCTSTQHAAGTGTRPSNVVAGGQCSRLYVESLDGVYDACESFVCWYG